MSIFEENEMNASFRHDLFHLITSILIFKVIILKILNWPLIFDNTNI
jgi:hypothetical protein